MNMPPVVHDFTIRLLAIAAIITLAGCASAPERHAVPAELFIRAGIPEARFWGDEWPKFGKERLDTFTEARFI